MYNFKVILSLSVDFFYFKYIGVLYFYKMKLLQALRLQIAEEQTKIANVFAKQVGFNSIHDSHTVIEREHAKHAWKWLVNNKQLLLDSFPKENVKKLLMVDTVDANTDLSEILVIFKQILRSQKARLISRKRYDWNVEQRRQSYTLEYRIISATPDPTPQQQTPPQQTSTLPAPPTTTPQTPEKEQTNHNMSTVLVNDVKVSSTDEDIPPTVTMSAKRKLSPTPTNAQQSPAKKPKPHTPQKEQQPTPNQQVSDIKVLDASPIDTQPPNSPAPTEVVSVSPLPLSPTPEGGSSGEQVPVPLPAI